MKKKFKISFNGIVILFILLIVVAIATHFIPGGEYQRIEVNNTMVVDGSSFKYVTSNPTSFFDFFRAIPLGLKDAMMLVIMIFLIGGTIRIVESTNSIRAFIFYLKERLGDNRSYYILILISLFFAFLGSFPGMLEAVIPFAPLCIGISLALGYDKMVGISISLLPIVVGWASGVTNPWTTGIGQNLAQLKMFSGIGFRFVAFVIFMIVTILYTLNYAKKVKNKNKLSENSFEIDSHHEKLSIRHILVLLIFASTIGVIVFGSIKLSWDMVDMSAVYIIGGILCGLSYGYGPNKIADEIINGGRDMYIAAFAIGLARAVSVIMTNSNIIDTVVHATATILQGNSQVINAFGMFFLQTIINFFVPSGSGQAVVTLPILLPVSDLIGLNRQIAILAFQYGDGFSNLMYPTVGALIAILSYSKIKFSQWIKYIYKFLIIIFILSLLIIYVAVKINFS